MVCFFFSCVFENEKNCQIIEKRIYTDTQRKSKYVVWVASVDGVAVFIFFFLFFVFFTHSPVIHTHMPMVDRCVRTTHKEGYRGTENWPVKFEEFIIIIIVNYTVCVYLVRRTLCGLRSENHRTINKQHIEKYAMNACTNTYTHSAHTHSKHQNIVRREMMHSIVCHIFIDIVLNILVFVWLWVRVVVRYAHTQCVLHHETWAQRIRHENEAKRKKRK